MTDADWKILHVNPAFTRLTGYGELETRGRTPPFFLSGERKSSLVSTIGSEVAASGAWSGEIFGRRRDGSVYPGRLAVNAVADAAGSLTGFLLIHSDLSRSQSDAELIHHLSHHDPLTGLPNWDRLRTLLRETLATAGAEREVAVVLVDLDRFRTINEGLGHHIGDYILQALAERVVRHAGPEAVVARRGSDSFCIVRPHPCARELAASFVPALLAALAEPLQLFGHEYGLTASAGISLYPLDGSCTTSLLRYAEVAIAHAKRAGRNNFQFFVPAMKAVIEERLTLENGLRHALERHELLLHYQPLFDLASGRVAGVEALVRWQHPELGLIQPGQFIPLAEETGWIIAIGDWVLHQACQQGRRWHLAGHRRLQVAVNVSPLQFRQHHFTARVAAILAETGFDPACLDLEITEGTIMQEPDRAAAILRRLKHHRIRIAVDDFGTGYSSLAYLKHYPIDRLKIDRSFVTDCHMSPQDAAIVDTVIGLARNLGLEVIAEGVENDAQLRFLQHRRCDLVQGYLFSRPAPAAEIEAMLAKGWSMPALSTAELPR